uniref:DC_STAMP domain-containing protein n=1 Tax=Nippostrongylus brasiliensis TaxID=27835 RepID=A0A0N4YYV3_NIPBR
LLSCISRLLRFRLTPSALKNLRDSVPDTLEKELLREYGIPLENVVDFEERCAEVQQQFDDLIAIPASDWTTMRKVCPLLGPKASAFCMVMSVWGIIFLVLLGVFFYLQAVTLFPDLHFSEESREGGHADLIFSQTLIVVLYMG